MEAKEASILEGGCMSPFHIPEYMTMMSLSNTTAIPFKFDLKYLLNFRLCNYIDVVDFV